MASWSQLWQLSISLGKCACLHLGRNNPNHTYFLNGCQIESSSSCKDLGVVLSFPFNFKAHIESTVGKCSRLINLIFRIFSSNDKSALLKAYITYVRPIAEYCSQVWSPCQLTLIDRLERIQRLFTRRLFRRLGLDETTSYCNRLKFLHLDSLELRRLRFCLLYTSPSPRDGLLSRMPSSA